jgi:hypothetical protein
LLYTLASDRPLIKNHRPDGKFIRSPKQMVKRPVPPNGWMRVRRDGPASPVSSGRQDVVAELLRLVDKHDEETV